MIATAEEIDAEKRGLEQACSYTIKLCGIPFRDSPAVMLIQNGDISQRIRIESPNYRGVAALDRALRRGYYPIEAFYEQHKGDELDLLSLLDRDSKLYAAVIRANSEIDMRRKQTLLVDLSKTA